MSKKKRRQDRKVSASSTLSKLALGLKEAESFMRHRRWDKALEKLEALEQRYPNRVEVLTDLVNVYYELHDMRGYQRACERLVNLTPNDPDVILGLAGAYMTNLRPVMALRTFRRFLERFPHHHRSEEVRKTVTELEAKLKELLSEGGFAGEGGFELAGMHEEMQLLLERGEYAKARQVAEKMLRVRSDFAPALNNMSQTYFLEGRLDEAICASERVLSFDPNNYHALSNMSRYLSLSGRMEEASRFAERLKAVESEHVDIWVKKAEALSYLGDDEGVIDAFMGAKRAGHLKTPFKDPLLYHLAAVAAMRLGREKEARQYWQEALKLSPGFELARENLADLRRPVGKRDAPWAFNFENWIPRKLLSDLTEQLERVTKSGNENAVTETVRRYLRQHPEVVALIPLLLDRGDRLGRIFAFRTALMAETPETLTALRDFALSQRGPDKMRYEAAHAASKAGILPPGRVRLWMEGEWRELLLMGFELHDEPTCQHQPKVEELLEEAIPAIKRGEVNRGERLLKEALELEPDAPDLLNNLAAAYGLQGRSQDVEDTLRQIIQSHPDYAFAHINLARIFLERDEIDKAKELLEPLFSFKRLHFTEFAAFCSVYIQISLAEGKLDVAHSWLEMWATADPENPEVKRWRRQLDKFKWMRSLFRHRT